MRLRLACWVIRFLARMGIVFSNCKISFFLEKVIPLTKQFWSHRGHERQQKEAICHIELQMKTYLWLNDRKNCIKIQLMEGNRSTIAVHHSQSNAGTSLNTCSIPLFARASVDGMNC